MTQYKATNHAYSRYSPIRRRCTTIVNRRWMWVACLELGNLLVVVGRLLGQGHWSLLSAGAQASGGRGAVGDAMEGLVDGVLVGGCAAAGALRDGHRAHTD